MKKQDQQQEHQQQHNEHPLNEDLKIALQTSEAMRNSPQTYESIECHKQFTNDNIPDNSELFMGVLRHHYASHGYQYSTDHGIIYSAFKLVQ